MANLIDLDAYCARVHWQGARAPTLATLAGLVDAQIRHIPFENLDVLLGRPIRLDLDSLQEKLIVARRGGYCFEHATLFQAVLTQLGFHPVAHSARVILVTPRSEAPRTHMFLTVPLPEGRFLVDPGFGGLAPRAPIRLADGAETDGGTHLLERDGREWILKARTEGKVVELWTSTVEPELPIDFELANYYVSTHPRSAFVQRLMLRAFTDFGQVSVMNRDVTISRGGERERHRLADRQALRRLLVEHFGFELPEVERLRVPAVPEWE